MWHLWAASEASKCNIIGMAGQYFSSWVGQEAEYKIDIVCLLWAASEIMHTPENQTRGLGQGLKFQRSLVTKSDL